MEGDIELPFGLATSVGPLPGVDADAAVSCALAAQPDFPTAPTLAGPAASLWAQAVEGVEGVGIARGGGLVVDAGETIGPARTGIDGPAFAPLRSFLDRIGDRPRIGLRVGLLGPVTLALALRAAGVPDAVATRLAGQVCARRAASVLGTVRRVDADAVVMVVAVEPGLVGAMHPTFPLSPSSVVDLLAPFVSALDDHPRAGRLLIGAHVPGRTDWPTVLSAGFSVASAPADAGMLTWTEELADFLGRGGRVAWGAVPVDRPLGTGEELLWRRLSALWCELVGLGLDPMLLRTRSLIGPADGLSHFGPSQAERVLSLVGPLSVRVRRQAIGARLSLGA